MKLWNFKGKQNRIADALQLSVPEHAVISITGSGGKTNLMFAWARELAAEGRKVVITTTTHMTDPEHASGKDRDPYEGIRFISESYNDTAECLSPGYSYYGGFEEGFPVTGDSAHREELFRMIDETLNDEGIVFIAGEDRDHQTKVKAPSAELISGVSEIADVILIEADGSRRMPLKWPAAWEPAVPPNTDICVCVAGLTALGRGPKDVICRYSEIPEVFIYRKSAAGMNNDGSRLPLGEVDEQLIFALLSSREGGQKGAAGEFRIFLNQADSEREQLAAAKIQAMLAMCGIQSAWGSLVSSAESSMPLTDHSFHSEANKEDAILKYDTPEDSSSDDLTIAVILEAAGNSTRFGSNKLLHILDDGRPMVCCMMDTVCEAEDLLHNRREGSVTALKKILVTQYEEVAAMAPDFDVVMNDRPDLGISRSMKLGIEAAGDADAYMFCVCDQPGLKAHTLVRMIKEFRRSTADGGANDSGCIVSLSWDGKMRNPKIFPSWCRNELMALNGDSGGRQIIAAHRDDLILVEAGSEAEVTDIDRPLLRDLLL